MLFMRFAFIVINAGLRDTGRCVSVITGNLYGADI